VSEDSSRMVEVGAKDVTERRAAAEAEVRMRGETVERLEAGTEKGHPLEAARIAGLLAVKRTPELLPFCHPVAVTGAEIEVTADRTGGRIVIRAVVRARDRTGVEMEALTACAIAALSIYDTAKAFQQDAVIERIALVEKRGGASGDYPS
jgi:cyclic pyranopterin monophosphate synthase